MNGKQIKDHRAQLIPIKFNVEKNVICLHFQNPKKLLISGDEVEKKIDWKIVEELAT